MYAQVKCDAVKPACGACLKSASAQGRPLNEVTCEYDDESTITRRSSGGRRKSTSEGQTGSASNKVNNNGHGNTDKVNNGNELRRPAPTQRQEHVRMTDNGMASIEKSLRLEAESKTDNLNSRAGSSTGYSRGPSPYGGSTSSENIYVQEVAFVAFVI